MIPPTRYARSEGADIAYKVLGAGPRDIVVSLAFASHLEVFWELPENADFIERLSRLGRVILFDKRGTGLSDRQLAGVSLEQRCDDVIAVMDDVGSAEAVLLGWLDTGAVSLLTAARHPGRVAAVIAGEVLAVGHPDVDHPYGMDPVLMTAMAESLEAGGWGQALLAQMVAPEIASSPRQLAWWCRYESMSATPSAAARLLQMNADLDLRPFLVHIQVPVLLIHDEAWPLASTEAVRWLADRLPTAELKLVRSTYQLVNPMSFEAVSDEIEEFLEGTRVGGGTAREVATLLVTDVVGSTATAVADGDVEWKHLLSTHRAGVRRSLARFGGSEIDTAGDGFLASFPLPSSALACAAEVTEHARAEGVGVRAGLHTGEVLLQAAGIVGIAVHVAARVAAAAGPSEVLFTETVKSLVMGSRIESEPAGTHTLKGVPGQWRLYRLVSPER